MRRSARCEKGMRGIVMAALDAAIQPIHATLAWRRDWMAGTSPAMTNWESRVDCPPIVMAVLEAAIQPIHATAARRRDWMAGASPAMTGWG
jgi:hypothetical protein